MLQDLDSNNVVYSFKIVVITSILQKMDQFENREFELSSRSKMFDLKHSNVLSIVQKKLCYRYNHLGVIPFEYIAGVTRDGKFAGSMINQSTQIVLMDKWTNDSLCCEDAKRILQGYYLFILLLFSVITPHCSMFYFQLTGFFVKMVIILDSMCISLSGGILMVPQKDREASKFIYNSGF